MIIALVALLQAASPSSAHTPLKPAEWVEDLDSLVANIRRVHPRPFRRISAERFSTMAATLRRDIPKLRDDVIATRMMRLGASLRDGHTSLAPFGGRAGFTHWYPVRFYRFTDGVFITAIHPELAPFNGAKVVRVGNLDAERAADSTTALMGSDNELGAREHTMFLSSPEALAALGINSSMDSLELDVITRAGERRSLRIPSVVVNDASLDWLGNGEIDGPGGTKTVSVFGKTRRGLLDPDSNASLPLHVRGRRAYWYTPVSAARTMYLQINAMVNKSAFSPVTFEENYRRAFAYVDAHPHDIDRLVIDLRYNFGGNGDLVDGLVHEVIKRDSTVNRSGHLFVLTGRKTFSAGADLMLQLRRHTAAILVGEPAGAGVNASGNPTDLTLKNSGFHLSLSTNWGQSANSDDTTWVVPVEIPAPFTSSDYLEGRDPALDMIFATPVPFPTIVGTIRSEGAAAGERLFNERNAKYGAMPWWQPFKLNDINNLGYAMLAEKKAEDAVIVFRLNTMRFPTSWYVWDSLSDAYTATAKRDLAIAALRRALELDPSNPEAGNERKKVQELSGKAP